MINITRNGNALSILFKDNDKYLFDGQMDIAINELIVIVDSSDAITFKRTSNGDVLFSQNVSDIQIEGNPTSKETIINDFAAIGYAGGGTGAVDSVNGMTGAVVLTANDLNAYTKDEINTKLAALNIEGKLDTTVYEEDKKSFALKDDLSGFITNTVDNLTNYYKKSETYTQTEVNNLIGAIETVKLKKVSVLPKVGESNTIYLVPKTVTKKSNTYEEWIYVDNTWELIGTTDVNLDGYATQEWVNQQSFLKEVPAEYITETELEQKNYATKSELPDTSDMATQSWVNGQGFLTSVPEGYATDEELTNALASKQDTLVSGSNIKTINNESILGEGNIEIKGGVNIVDNLESDSTTSALSAAQGKVLKGLVDSKQPTGDYALKSDIPTFDATELFTKSQDQGTLTTEFRQALDAALIAKKVLYINDTQNNIFAVVTFISKGDSFYSFQAVSAEVSYSLVLDINANTVTIKQAAKGYGFNKYETEYPVSVFELSAQSTNNDIQRAFSSNDNGVVIPSAGDVFEVREPGAVSGMVIRDSGIVTSRIETNGNIDLVLISNNLVDDYIVVHTIKLSYDSAQGPDSLAVEKAIHSVIDPALITQEKLAPIIGNVFTKGEVTEALNKKQNTLVGTQTVGQNIKTINGETILGTGDIQIAGGGIGRPGTGTGSVILGDSDCTATGDYNVAEGTFAASTGSFASHAEGSGTTASGKASHAEGLDTQATGSQAHSEGQEAIASGVDSHAEGKGTKAQNYVQHSSGQYNTEEETPSPKSFDATKTLFSIGNGTSDTNRSDALKMLGNGTIWIQGIGDFNGKNATELNSLQAILLNIMQSLEGVDAKISEINNKII